MAGPPCNRIVTKALLKEEKSSASTSLLEANIVKEAAKGKRQFA